MAPAKARDGIAPKTPFNLPLIYKAASQILSGVNEKKATVKNLIYSDKRLKGEKLKKATYALVFETLKYQKIIKALFEKTKLFEHRSQIDYWVASVLTYDLLFGSRSLRGESSPVKFINEKQQVLSKALEKLKSKTESADLFSSVLEIRKTLPRYARINTLVTSVPNVIRHLTKNGYEQVLWEPDVSFARFLELAQLLKEKEFMVDFHFSDLLVFHPKTVLYTLKIYSNGSIVLQDKTSIFPVTILNPPPDSIVMDACAAPGMKTTHLAALMKNTGTIYAIDHDRRRIQLLDKTLKHASVENCLFSCGNFSFVDTEDEAFKKVEYILLDPSCSGSGMVSRMDDLTDDEESKTSQRFEKLQGFQVALLKHSLEFPSVKRIVYSTCSVNVEENEEVVKQAMGYFPGQFEVVEAFPEWPVRGNENYDFGAKCVRANPFEHLTNGFFVATLERTNVNKDGNECHSEHVEEPEKTKGKHKKKKKNKKNAAMVDYVQVIDFSNKQDDSLISKENDDSFHKKRKKHARSKNDLEAETFPEFSAETEEHFIAATQEENVLEVESTVNASVRKKKKKHTGSDKHGNTMSESFQNLSTEFEMKTEHKQSCATIPEENTTEIVEGIINPNVCTAHKKKKTKHSRNEKDGNSVSEDLQHFPADISDILPEENTLHNVINPKARSVHKKKRKHSNSEKDENRLSETFLEFPEDVVANNNSKNVDINVQDESVIPVHKKKKHSRSKNNGNDLSEVLVDCSTETDKKQKPSGAKIQDEDVLKIVENVKSSHKKKTKHTSSENSHSPSETLLEFSTVVERKKKTKRS